MLKEIRCDHCQAFLCYRQKGGALQVWTFVLRLRRSDDLECAVCGKLTKVYVEQEKREVALAK